jgi:hypothetical protein
VAAGSRDRKPSWSSSGRWPWWALGVQATVLLVVGAALLLRSPDLHGPWQWLSLVGGWFLVVLGVWCLYFFSFMATLAVVDRYPGAMWIVRPLVVIGILFPIVAVLYLTYR